MRKPVLALLVLGLLQMAADILHVPALKAMAAATAASPAPKVFSAVRDLETYSTNFFVEWTDGEGRFHSVEITPARYERLRGPYNRRNTYGAVLAYGPILQSDPKLRPMFDSVSHYALCGDAPLLHEIDIHPESIRGPLRIRLEARAGSHTGNLPLSFEAPCQ